MYSIPRSLHYLEVPVRGVTLKRLVSKVREKGPRIILYLQLRAETPKLNTAGEADANGSTAMRETHEKEEKYLLNFAVCLLT
jgi:hypothetical protein